MSERVVEPSANLPRRVLVFAYACHPDQGSEPGAGATLARIIAGISDDVVVITRRESGLSADQLGERLGDNVTVLHAGPRATNLPTYLRYLLWIIDAARVAHVHRKQQAFTIVHHLTYASDWFVHPFLLMRKRKSERWVWGPAGGASYAPYAVGRAVTGSMALGELARSVSTRTLRAVVHRLSRSRVDVALALNVDSERSFGASGFANIAVQANAVLDYDELPTRVPPADPLLVYAGRGVRWKGLPLVIGAMRYLPSEWTLVIAGPGTEAPFFRRLAAPLGDRVSFVGKLDRASTLNLFAAATAVALPSLHDSAPWSAAESAGIGTPVVCLDLGGVATMAGTLAITVPARPTRNLAERYAAAVAGTHTLPPTVSQVHTREALETTLDWAYGGGTRS